MASVNSSWRCAHNLTPTNPVTKHPGWCSQQTRSADSVRLVTNVAGGAIHNTTLCTFSEVKCGGFEAGASRGYLWANVSNTGTIAATFTLTVRGMLQLVMKCQVCSAFWCTTAYHGVGNEVQQA